MTTQVANALIADNSITPAKFANSGYELGMRNRIINGDFKIAQRATTYALTTSVAYGSVDRWVAYQNTTAAGIANQVALGTNGFQYALKLGRNAAATSTGAIVAATALETANCVSMAGQTVTLSFYAKAGANFSGTTLNAYLYSGTGTDQSVSSMVGATWTGFATQITLTQAITTTLTRYTATVTLPSTVTQLGVMFIYTPTGTAGADDNVYITGVQLEIGATATPFEYRPYGTELMLCQRYYYRMQGTAAGNEYFGTGMNYSAAMSIATVPFPVQMRAIPSALEQSGTATDYRWLVNGGTTVCASVPTHNGASIFGATVAFNVASGLTVGQAALFRSVNANSYLGWSAEL